MSKNVWRYANMKLVPSAALFIIGAVVCNDFGNVRSGRFDHRLVALIGLIAFVAFAVTFLQVFGDTVYKIIARHHLGPGRAGSIRFVIRAIGYIAILFMTLNLLDISVGRLLLGGAALGIILGVAAQQALANFFASIVLIIVHPFDIGEDITVKSGALGGETIGTVIDIGLTHTRLEQTNGNIIALPNATLLSSASISSKKKIRHHTTTDTEASS